MKSYRFGDPAGRFIGSSEGIMVYPSIIHGHAPIPLEQKAAIPQGEFYFNYGPSTGGLMESVGIDFLTPGELVTRTDVNAGYKMRTLPIKGRSIEDALLIVERINAFHSASHSIAFISAVEDAIEMQLPDGVMQARMIEIEIERIRSNLLVLERMCQPAGFGVPSNQISYLKEKVSRLVSTATGHRYFFNSIFAGGCNINFSKIESILEEVSLEFQKIYDDLLESKIFMNRLFKNGKISEEWLVGPAARASGLKHDARLDSPTLDYTELEFTPVTHTTSDSFSRFQVRADEIFQSVDMIHTLLRRARSVQTHTISGGSGQGAARIESPQGDLFYYVKVRKGIIDDVVLVSPSLSNMEAFRESMNGNIFTDFHFNWESFGIWISEAGVKLV